MSLNNNNYYNANSFPSIERAIVAEDIRFSNINAPIIGKFFIKVLTPGIDTSEPMERNINGVIQTNYFTLAIPPFLVLQYMNPHVSKINDKEFSLSFNLKDEEFIIPAGSVFFVEFLGGDIRLEKIIIVAAYPPTTTETIEIVDNSSLYNPNVEFTINNGTVNVTYNEEDK